MRPVGAPREICWYMGPPAPLWAPRAWHGGPRVLGPLLYEEAQGPAVAAVAAVAAQGTREEKNIKCLLSYNKKRMYTVIDYKEQQEQQQQQQQQRNSSSPLDHPGGPHSPA